MKELKSQSQKVSIFTSKSNILKFLQSRLKYSKIERILDFTVDDWNKNKNQILQQAGTAMLAQANSQSETVLSLLK